MSSNKQQRAAATRKLKRQAERRSQHAHAARQRMMIIGVVIAVIVIAGAVWIVSSLGGGGEQAGGEQAGADAGSSADKEYSDSDQGSDPGSAGDTGADADAPGSDAATNTGGSTDTTGSAADTACSYPTSGSPAKPVDPPTDLNPPDAGTITATIALNTGDVTVDLDRSNAPCAINSLVSLASQGYFADTPCHRLTTADSLKVLQCGDPTGTGTGGPGYSFPDELTGDETYSAGTLAMANAGPDTNGSQFFIVYGDSQLPPKYTVLGHVTSGLDVVQAIADQGTDTGGQDGAPVDPVTIKSITVDA